MRKLDNKLNWTLALVKNRHYDRYFSFPIPILPMNPPSLH